MTLKNLFKVRNKGKEMRVRYTHTTSKLPRFPEVISLQGGRVFRIIPVVTERHYSSYNDFEIRQNRNFNANYVFPTPNYFRCMEQLEGEEFGEELRRIRKGHYELSEGNQDERA